MKREKLDKQATAARARVLKALVESEYADDGPFERLGRIYLAFHGSKEAFDAFEIEVPE